MYSPHPKGTDENNSRTRHSPGLRDSKSLIRKYICFPERYCSQNGTIQKNSIPVCSRTQVGCYSILLEWLKTQPIRLRNLSSRLEFIGIARTTAKPPS